MKNGFSKRLLAFHERKKEILAGAYHHCPGSFGPIDHAGRRHGGIAVYLYSFLMMTMRRQKSNPKLTILALTTGLIVLHLITGRTWAILAALVIAVAGLSSNTLSSRIDFLWMKLAGFLNRIITGILLGATFFFLLFPLALLSRLFGKKDPLNLRNGEQSTFRSTLKKFDKVSFEKTW